MAKKLKAAILGGGNVGTDLLIKTLRSPYLECSLFASRNLLSPGITKAGTLGVRISNLGIEAIEKEPDCCDLVFDATSAGDHLKHWPILEKLGKTVIDMTPSKIGKMCVPAVNLEACLNDRHVNMITCGGQASIPLACLLGDLNGAVDYIEVVTTIASRSSGPATRLNIDEYVETTEEGLRFFARCARAKTILIQNPAVPCVDMQTTIFAKMKNQDLETLTARVNDTVEKVRRYVPGYTLLAPPTMENGRLVILLKIRGLGDYLPKYAGNLDIINCAAIAIAEEYAKKRF